MGNDEKFNIGARELVSRGIAAATILFIVVPATKLLAVGVMFFPISFLGGRVAASTLIVGGFLIVAMAILAVVWRVSLDFVIRGPRCFDGVHPAWWRLMAVGFVAALPSLLLLSGAVRDLRVLWGGVSGAALLVPAIHMWFEKRRYLRSIPEPPEFIELNPGQQQDE